MSTTPCVLADDHSHKWGDWPKWGDQGDGTYLNPVIPSDYSDVDCIRVDSEYYAVSSTFQFSPGFVILRSKDLVNWSILGHVVPDFGHLMKAGNTLTQRCFRTTSNEVIVKLDLSGMADGQKCGLCHFAGAHSSLGVSQNGKTRTLAYDNDGKVTAEPEIPSDDLWIKSTWGSDGKSQYAYSFDGQLFTDFGDPYQLTWGNYRGDRIGIYSFNNKAEDGYVDVDFFHYSYPVQQTK
jgi:beta-xylosidase